MGRGWLDLDPLRPEGAWIASVDARLDAMETPRRIYGTYSLPVRPGQPTSASRYTINFNTGGPLYPPGASWVDLWISAVPHVCAALWDVLVICYFGPPGGDQAEFRLRVTDADGTGTSAAYETTPVVASNQIHLMRTRWLHNRRLWAGPANLTIQYRGYDTVACYAISLSELRDPEGGSLAPDWTETWFTY